MNYEQKYKEALERATKIHSKERITGIELVTCEEIFHELKESEDEKIRKELIERFKWELKGAEEQDAAGCSRQKDIAMFKRGIAWLEKQGKKSEYDSYKVTVESIADMCKTDVSSIDLVDFYGNVKVKCKEAIDYDKTWTEKQGEQKPAWSEEDEEKLNSIIEVLGEDSLLVNWLKSLKPQPNQYDKGYNDGYSAAKYNHWKPSEEQMMTLCALCVLHKESKVLESLYNDLKKL